MYRYGGNYDRGYSTGATFNTCSQMYWERSLFQRMRTLFKFSGLPDAGKGQVQTDKDAFLYGLYKLGFLCMFETKQYGITFQPATPYGFGLQYQPIGMTVNSPYFQFTRPLQIGNECEVIKLTPDYQGVWDLVSKYATELKYTEIAIRLSQINARFAYAIAAEDNKTAESVRTIVEKLENGEPAIVYDKKLKNMLGETGEMPWQQFDRDLSKNFILPELLEVRRTILRDFYTELGVRVAPNKKERMVTQEAVSYDAETFNRREVFNISLQESLERCNKRFGTNIKAEFIEPEQLGGVVNADSAESDK